MKRILIPILAAILACACEKSPVETISGSYSFKNGGTLEVLRKSATDKAGDTVLNLSLAAESGQMKILPKGGNEIVVTMNVLGKKPVVFNGKFSDGTITLFPTESKVMMFNEHSFLDIMPDALLSIGGTGTVYGSTIVFEMTYSGSFNSEVYTYRILSSNVNCIATRNE